MGFLGSIADFLSQFFTGPEYFFGAGEDLLHGVEAIGHEISTYFSLVWLGVVVALEVENPIGIEVGVD